MHVVMFVVPIHAVVMFVVPIHAVVMFVVSIHAVVMFVVPIHACGLLLSCTSNTSDNILVALTQQRQIFRLLSVSARQAESNAVPPGKRFTR